MVASDLAHVVLTVVVVHRTIVTRKSEWTFASVMRSVIDALGSVVTGVEIFGTELYFCLAIITCDAI